MEYISLSDLEQFQDDVCLTVPNDEWQEPTDSPREYRMECFNCEATPEERRAMDEGAQARENDAEYGATLCPYTDQNLREIWQCGYDFADFAAKEEAKLCA